MLTCQIFITPPTLINNQGHELEEAFIVHASWDKEPELSKPFCIKLHDLTRFLPVRQFGKIKLGMVL